MYKRYYDIDVDAKAYANNIVKAGGRIPSDIGSVSDFIRKLKQNNLWASFGEGWLMRSTQNIGSGTTLYPMKNFDNKGVIDGVIPWSQAGLIFSGAGPYIVCSSLTSKRLATQKNISVFAVGTCPTSGSQGSFVVSRVSSSNYLYIWLNPRTSFGGEFRFGGSNASTSDNTATGFNMWASTGGVGKRTIGYRNTTAIATNASVDASNSGHIPEDIGNGLWENITFGRDGTSYQGTFSHCFIFTDYLSSADVTTVYNIIKSTIGKGLNLP